MSSATSSTLVDTPLVGIRNGPGHFDVPTQQKLALKMHAFFESVERMVPLCNSSTYQQLRSRLHGYASDGRLHAQTGRSRHTRLDLLMEHVL